MPPTLEPGQFFRWSSDQAAKPGVLIYDMPDDSLWVRESDGSFIQIGGGAGTGDLLSGNNLSDIDDAAIARVNLNAQRKHWVNILDFDGVDPTGATDSSAGIQAAIDFAISTGDPSSTVRRGLAGLYAPTGLYLLEDPLVVESVIDFAMFGDGPGLTRFKAGAADMTTVIDLNGVAYCRFEDFTVTGNDNGGFSAERGIWLRYNGVSRSTTRNVFRNVHVRNLKYVNGIELGDHDEQGVQVDISMFFGCHVTGAWAPGEETWYQAGVYAGDGTHANNLMHNFFGCTSITNRTNVYVDATQVMWVGGCTQNAEQDFFVGSQKFTKIVGLRSEGSTRLLVSGGPASYAGHVTIEDVDWVANELHEDGSFILWKLGGHLSLRSVTIPYRADITNPNITTSAAVNHMVTLDQCSTQTPVEDVVDLPANGRAEINGYVQLAASNVASTMTGRRVAGLVATDPVRLGSSTGPQVRSGAGTPEGAVAAPVGSVYARTDGGAGTSLYVKEVGTDANGWAAPVSGMRIQTDTFTANGTWTKPSWAKKVTLTAYGAGGGGGSGRRGAATTVRSGGGGGGGGGYVTAVYPAAQLPASLSVAVGAGGAGGPAVTTDDTNGTAGSTGGNTNVTGTDFYIRAAGGTGGGAGSTAAGAAGTGGPTAQNGGASSATGGSGSAPGPTSISVFGSGGGGGGGGITAADSPSAGAAGGAGVVASSGNNGAAGTVPGGVGGDGVAAPTASLHGAGGGGGGAGSITGAAGAGGAGGSWGGGGGGGGGSLNSNASGAGGNGGPGLVVVISEG